MENWNPRRVERFIRGFPTSAKTALVETDAGPGYLKAMGTSEGLQTLASEVVATQLAKWFGLSTLDWAIVEVDEFVDIPFVDASGNQIGKGEVGPAFITRAVEGITWSGGTRELDLLINPEDISRMVVFDTWVLNCDRRAPFDSETNRRRKPNRDNVFLSEDAPAGQFRLMAIDHTHCFTCGREWTPRLANVDKMKDARLFGVFPEWRPYLRRAEIKIAAEQLLTISRQIVDEMVAKIPLGWNVSDKTRAAIVDLITGRAAFLAGSIEKAIWPQGVLFREDDDGSSKP